MGPDKIINVKTSESSCVNLDNSKEKGKLKGSEIIVKSKKKDAKICKIEEINVEKAFVEKSSCSLSTNNSLSTRLKPSSTHEENKKINQIKNESIASPLPKNKIDSTQNKTNRIIEKCIRYIIDPYLQIEDILMYVDNCYKDHPLKPIYDLVKEIVDIDDLRNISEDMKQKILEAAKTPEFFRILPALAKFKVCREEIKKYDKNISYKFNPLRIAQIAYVANQLITFDYLESLLGFPEGAGEEFLNEIKEKPITQMIDKESFTEMEIGDSRHFYKHFYPIVLCGDLGLYTFEAELYAYANSLAFLGVGGSSRGVHGGRFQSPLEVFIHDAQHHSGMLFFDNPTQAFHFQKLSQAFLEIIQKQIPENLRKTFYFGAHLLLHEGGNLNIKEDILISKDPKLSTIFDFYFCEFLDAAFRGTFFLQSNNFEPTESFLRKLQVQEEQLIQKFGKLSDQQRKKLEASYKDCEQYKKNHANLDDLCVTEVLRDDPFGYDLVEALLFLTDDMEQKKEIQNKILPEFSNFSQQLMKRLKNMYEITDETDKNSELFITYRNDYNHQLYLYKTKNFNHVEAYKAVKKFVINFRMKILPYLKEQDQVNGPLNASEYISIWDKGRDIK